ncbi:exodeoxyribonuclease VII large subunit [Campylobacter hominis]
MTVSELNEQAKSLLESHFTSIEVVGEISRFTRQPTSGHWYFTLKDEKASISCAMFKSTALRVKFIPKDGLKVIITGKVSIYSPTGNYQIIAASMKLAGEGELEAKFSALKQKLSDEGLFAEEYKKPLPKFPQKIAFLTSLSSAAYQDMLRVARDRFALVKIDAYSVFVQGENTASSVISALKTADKKDYDCIIIARGGGSKEDLWGFNDENLARAIFAAHTPVISAIGHEIDFSISDFVADHRSLTPTAAMMDLLPDVNTLLQDLSGADNFLINFINSCFKKCENALNVANLSLKTKSVDSKILKFENDLREGESKLKNFIKFRLSNFENRLNLNTQILKSKAKFFEITKNLVSISKDGKIVNLKDLKSGDNFEISSQEISKQAKIL